jgi:ISXO2-like transposase domain
MPTKPDRGTSYTPATSFTGSTTRKPTATVPASYTNNAESFFSRMRRGEIGHHHHIAGPYLIRFAQEAAWREDHRKEPNGFQVDRLVALAMAARPSVDFCGYWQRSAES